MALDLSILNKNNIKIQKIQCFQSISKLKKLQNFLQDQKLSFIKYQRTYTVSKYNLISFLKVAEMNTISNEIITYFNFFDFFKLSVDFEFKELENEIYFFIDQHNIKFPKKDFLNKDDLLQFYDTFSFDTEPDELTIILPIPANVLSITKKLQIKYSVIIHMKKFYTYEVEYEYEEEYEEENPQP